MKNYNTEKNIIREYFDYLEGTIGAEAVKDIISKSTPSESKTFLSIVMRTVGNRIDMLSEVLMCLSSQTNMDFEVLLMGHNLKESARESVLKVVNSFPKEFSDKIRLIDVIGGNRTTPLNQGFENAQGEYITILDDDDLVFDNWVETFYNLYCENKGKILHAYAVSQNWKLVDGIPVSTSPFNNVYCRDFNISNQMAYNNCPVMSLAFPAYVFKEFGIHFDETLTTTEDWDFLMKTVFLCGVCDSRNVTSIYRLWQNVQNSQTMHNENEWTKNYNKIQKRITKCKFPINAGLLSNSPSGSVSMLPNQTGDSLEIEIFIDKGKGFNANDVAEFEAGYFGNNIKVDILQPESLGKIQRIRFDPCDLGLVRVGSFKCNIADSKNEEIKAQVNYDASNFVKSGKEFVFLDIDPQIVIDLPKPTVCHSVSIEFNLNKGMDINTLMNSCFKFLFSKGIRKIRGFYRLIVGKFLRRK